MLIIDLIDDLSHLDQEFLVVALLSLFFKISQIPFQTFDHLFAFLVGDDLLLVPEGRKQRSHGLVISVSHAELNLKLFKAHGVQQIFAELKRLVEVVGLHFDIFRIQRDFSADR